MARFATARPQPVVLATSEIKQGGASTADIVTTRPRRGARVGEGTVAMSVSGRPVFVLRGAQASHRDLRPGQQRPRRPAAGDSPAAHGLLPGPVDGLYDGETASAVADWYETEGWEPFGSTDAQLDTLRTARAQRLAGARRISSEPGHDQDDAGRRPARGHRAGPDRPRDRARQRRHGAAHPGHARPRESRSRSPTSAATTRSPPRTSRPSGQP